MVDAASFDTLIGQWLSLREPDTLRRIAVDGKEHGRLTRWRVQRKCLSPEEAGLCGCRQFIAIWRERHYLRAGTVYKEEQEYSYYARSMMDHRKLGISPLILKNIETSEMTPYAICVLNEKNVQYRVRFFPLV